MTSEAKIRTVALAIYAGALLAIQYWCIDTRLMPNENAIWLYGGLAGLLFGSRLLNPYFTAPADTAANGFVALIAILPAFPIVRPWTTDAFVLGLITAYCAVVAGGSIAVILLRRARGSQQTRFVQALDRAEKGLGGPTVIFGLLIISAVWLFHRDKPGEVFAILGILLVITAFRPFEVLADFWGWVRGLPRPIAEASVIGTIAAHQSPGIVLIRQADANRVDRGTPMVISDQHGPPLLGVALNYVGRDEGNLLRAVTAPLPAGIASRAMVPAGADGGTAYSVQVEPEEVEQIAALRWVERLCGIVDSDTSLEYMQFEVVDDSGLAEGCLVEADIFASHRRRRSKLLQACFKPDPVSSHCLALACVRLGLDLLILLQIVLRCLDLRSPVEILDCRVDQDQSRDFVRIAAREQPHHETTIGVADEQVRRLQPSVLQALAQLFDEVRGDPRPFRPRRSA